MDRIIDCLVNSNGYGAQGWHQGHCGKSEAENGHMLIDGNDIALFKIALSH